jgi:nucleoside-diphosphate-sugar epimerase
MILITGGFGKLGSSLIKKINNKKIVLIKRGLQYKKINNYTIQLNLNNRIHLKKIFNQFKFNTLIHLSVTRNPLRIKTIRDFSTLIKDTNISINILLEMRGIKKMIIASSASIYQLKTLPDKVNREKIIDDMVKFIHDEKKDEKIITKNYLEKKRKNLLINPLFHLNDNMRLNGSNKYINEILFKNYAIEKKIKTMIIRPGTIINTLKENKELAKKLNKLRK